MKSLVRISVLEWTDVLAKYAMWVMVTYLTNVWDVSIRRAAGIVNLWTGTENLMQLFMAVLSNEIMGKYFMLLFSSIAYSIGLGFLWMSTPPVLSNSIGNCTEYKSECISETQKVLFYVSLALIAIGISGHAVSLNTFLEENTKGPDNEEKDKGPDNEEKDNKWKKGFWSTVYVLGVVLPVVAGITIPYVKSWSIRFGIPALCTLLATLLFISGSRSYKDWCLPSQKDSPIIAVFRVFVASTFKIFKQIPADFSKLHGREESEISQRLPHRGLRFLDKAAIISTTNDNRWTLCNVEEVEAAKKIIRIVPICVTFIICGVVLSIGNTYFIEQANQLDREVGRLTVPLALFLAFYEFAKMFTSKLYSSSFIPQVQNTSEEEKEKNAVEDMSDEAKKKKEAEQKEVRKKGIYAPIIVTFCVYMYIELSCITAAKVEERRLTTVKKHDLLDKPDEKIPMSIFWLLPQFLLIGSADGLYKSAITHFFAFHAPPCMKEYRAFLHKAVNGLGTMGSVLFVFLVGKVSAIGGKPNWFQYTLNRSRLDRYYWTLAVLCAANLVLYSLAVYFYNFKLLLNEPIEEVEIVFEEAEA